MTNTRELVRIGQLELTFLSNSVNAANGVVIFELMIPPAAKVPMPHYHEHVDELVYGIAGITTSTIDGQRVEIGPGDHVFIPKGTIHHHDNKSDSPARTLCVLTPASIGIEYFKELGELIVPGVPPDAVKVSATMKKYGLIPVSQMS